MKKLYYSTIIIMGLSLLLLANNQIIKAQETSSDTKATADVSKPQDVDNKICPVSGERVGQGGMKPVTYEYNGRIYNFCCASCVDEFKKDPQKYIQIVEEELKAEKHQSPDGKMNLNKKDEMPMDMHGGHHK